MQRILGLLVLDVSMILFVAGGAAVPFANQWIADDCGFKTQTFLIGGIITMVAGATMACSAATGKTRERALKY